MIHSDFVSTNLGHVLKIVVLINEFSWAFTLFHSLLVTTQSGKEGSILLCNKMLYNDNFVIITFQTLLNTKD